MDVDKLREIADRVGILPGYQSVTEGWRETSDKARLALLEILGDEPQLPHSRVPERPPTRCFPVSYLVGDAQAHGLWLNLYTLRGVNDFGIGNFTHVAQLAEWAGPFGAQFIGLSPLHALRNRGADISPYSPHSRLFLNTIYIDPLAVPEFSRSRSLQELIARPEIRAEIAALRSATRVDYDRTRSLLERLFEGMHDQLVEERERAETPRHRELARFIAAGGELLQRFATFVCLEERLVAQGHPRDWRDWPPAYRSPESSEVAAFRARHARDIERQQFLQFEAERQLAVAHDRAVSAGMNIGLYRDLALSSLASSFDAWAFSDLFVSGVSLGAPPDEYAAHGQDWGLPPLDPRRLAGETPHPYFQGMLDANLRHTGALRIDHAMGLLRQFWIPEGAPASDGAYVRFPCLDLLDHIGRASVAHRAVVVGEDLGTVPAEFPELLARSAILSCRVLFFERNDDRSFRSPREFEPRALVTATTHDFPTLAGYMKGRDLEILHGLGKLSDAQLDAARAERHRDVERLHHYLDQIGVWEPGAEHEPLLLARAVYRGLRRTPCALVGIGLDNLTAETEPVNVPGVSVTDFPSWSRRMSMSVDQIVEDPRIRSAFEAISITG